MDDASEQTPMPYAPFWARLGAILLDTLLLSLFGWILGLVMFDTLARLGSYGPLLGFVFAVAYFGPLNSWLGNGQTLGKRCLHLRVVATDGRSLTLSASLLRATIYGAPLLASGLAAPLVKLGWPGMLLISLLHSGVIVISAYLFVFNRPSRRVLHDLVARSCVVLSLPHEGKATIPPFRRGHLVAIGLLLLLSVPLNKVAETIVAKPPFRDLMTAQQELIQLDGVQAATVAATTTYANGAVGYAITIDVRVLQADIHDRDFARRVVRSVLQHYPPAATASTITVSLGWGYDLGFAESLRRVRYSYDPANPDVERETIP